MAFLQSFFALCLVSIFSRTIVLAFPASNEALGSMNIAESFGNKALPFLFRRQGGGCVPTNDCSCTGGGAECDLNMSWLQGLDASGTGKATKTTSPKTKGTQKSSATHKSQKSSAAHKTTSYHGKSPSKTISPKTSKAPQSHKTTKPTKTSGANKHTTAAASDPLCIPGQNNGDVFDGNCPGSKGTYCVCSSGKDYITVPAATGSNVCPYTAIPKQRYTPGVCPPPPTPTKAPPKSSSPAPSSTPLSLRVIEIVYNNYLMSSGRGPALSNHVWKAWDIAKSEGFDICANNYVYRGLDNGAKQENLAQNDQFPIAIGPFDIQGHKSCNYKGPDHNTPGSVTCDGGFKIKCAAYTKDQAQPLSCATDIFGGSGENGESQRLYCNY